MIEFSAATAPFDEAQLCAAAFLARHSRRTLDAYRHDQRSSFQWTTDIGLELLAATRPHIDGRFPANPAQYVRLRYGQRLDRRTAHRWVRSIGKRTWLQGVHPHMLRADFIMAALDAGVPLRDV